MNKIFMGLFSLILIGGLIFAFIYKADEIKKINVEQTDTNNIMDTIVEIQKLKSVKNVHFSIYDSRVYFSISFEEPIYFNNIYGTNEISYKYDTCEELYDNIVLLLEKIK